MGRGKLHTALNWLARRPRQDLIACAMVVSVHPIAGLAAVDPVSGHCFFRPPGAGVIRRSVFDSSAGLPSDYFPVIAGQAPRLPRELAGRASVSHSVTEQQGILIEQCELQVKGQDPFVVTRRIDPAAGTVELQARFGAMASRAEVAQKPVPASYLAQLKHLARRVMPTASAT